MEKTDISKYFGVPVLLQLKTGIVIPVVSMKQKLPHASDPSTPGWVLEEAMEPFDPGIIPPPPPVFSSVPTIRYAVLYAVENVDDPTLIEVRWLIPGTSPKAPNTIVATLLSLEDVAFVTRVVSAAELPPEPSIVTLS